MNPGLEGQAAATSTLFAGMQLILPGEGYARIDTRPQLCAWWWKAVVRILPWMANAV